MKSIIKLIICEIVTIIDGIGIYCMLVICMGAKHCNMAAIISLMIAVLIAWIMGRSFEQNERLNEIMKFEVESK